MEAAIKDLDFLIENSPKYAKKARFERAIAYNVLKDYQAALKDYNAVIAEDEFDAEAWYQRYAMLRCCNVVSVTD